MRMLICQCRGELRHYVHSGELLYRNMKMQSAPVMENNFSASLAELPIKRYNVL